MWMYKEYMLKCEIKNEYTNPEWNRREYYFDTEDEMREFIESYGDGIRVEAMFKLEKIKW